MASSSTRTSARTRDRDKAVRGMGAGQDIAEANRPPRRSHQSRPEPPPIIIINGDVQITRGAFFSRSPDEELEPSRRPRLPTSNTSRENAPIIKRRDRIPDGDDEEEEEESEEIESARDSLSDCEPLSPPPVSRRSPASIRSDQPPPDSAYGGSVRGSRKEKNGAYRAGMSKKLSGGSLGEEVPSHTKMKTKSPNLESDVEDDVNSEENEAHMAPQREDREDQSDDSDDDFASRYMTVATNDNSEAQVRVILDTGTRPNWVSHTFLAETLKMKFTRRSEKEGMQVFSDFNNNKFTAIGRVSLLISYSDFPGMPCRNLDFLVAKKGSFQILIGRKTIEKENLLCRPAEPQREDAFPAVQTEPKKAEQLLMLQNKEKQKKEGAERDRAREESRKAERKEKREQKGSTSSAARLAQDSKPQRRKGRKISPSPSPSPPPPRNAENSGSRSSKSSWKKTKPPVEESSSSSSLSSGGAAIND